MRNSDASILGHVKRRCFPSLSLHHPYKSFSKYFYVPPFNPVAKKLLLKKYWKGTFTHLARRLTNLRLCV